MLHPLLRTQIGRNLRQERLAGKQKWTQQDFAEALEVTRSRISQIEAGKASLRCEDLAILNCVFALDIANILPDFYVQP